MPSVAGPKRPQDRIDLPNLKDRFVELFQAPTDQSGYGKAADELGKAFPSHGRRCTTAPHGTPAADQAHEAVEGHEPDTSLTTEGEMVGNHPTPDLLQIEDL